MNSHTGYSEFVDEPKAKGNGKAASDHFPIIDLDDIDPDQEPAYVIEGLLPASGLAVAYGLPKHGKSYIVADAVFNIAMGRHWAGRAVQQGAVAYCAGEGVSGLKRRLAG